MILHRYLSRLEDTILSRKEIRIEKLTVERRFLDSGYIESKLYFYDDSFLEFTEVIELREKAVQKVYYSYHYQKDDQCIFRYDNTPHHLELEGFPNHKHIGDEVLPAEPPDLKGVLQEIDAILYPIQASE